MKSAYIGNCEIEVVFNVTNQTQLRISMNISESTIQICSSLDQLLKYKQKYPFLEIVKYGMNKICLELRFNDQQYKYKSNQSEYGSSLQFMTEMESILREQKIEMEGIGMQSVKYEIEI